MTGAGLTVVLVVAGVIGFRLWLKAHDANVIEQSGIAARLEQIQHALDSLGREERRADTVFAVRRGELISSGKLAQANPTTENVEKLIRACDLTVAACEERTRLARERADSLQAQVLVLVKDKNKKPRWSLFAEAGYDPFVKDGRLGGGTELRLFGQLHGVARVDWTQPMNSAGRASVFIGGRWYFR
jgi:hypothetical protein